MFIAVAAIAGSLALLSVGLETGWEGFLVGFTMAVVPLPLYVWLATSVDQFEPEPSWLLIGAFFWGATIAVFFAMIANSVTEAIVASVAGAAQASMVTAVLSAPFVEELAKGAALFLLFVWRRDEFDNVTDGIIYASMVGLGFALTENVQYYSDVVVSGDDDAAIAVYFLRGVLGPFSHPLFTAMAGIGLGIARETDRKSVKILAPVIGLAVAMLLHALWNLGASFGPMFFAAYYVIMVPAFAAVIAMAIISLQREARIIRKHLEAVVAERVLSGDDVIVVTSVRRRIGASTRALWQGGPGKWKARRRFHALVSDLAFHCWRASRYANEDAAMHAELVEQVRSARAALGLPAEVQPPDAGLVARLSLEKPLPGSPASAI